MRCSKKHISFLAFCYIFTTPKNTSYQDEDFNHIQTYILSHVKFLCYGRFLKINSYETKSSLPDNVQGLHGNVRFHRNQSSTLRRRLLAQSESI